MTNITLSIEDEVYKKMRNHSEIKWSEFVRKIILKRILELENLENWPDNTILVAEATDPGWTPLFEKSKAIIVSRGGILSHCAIVAREMGLPAVGEVYGTMSLLKEGEYVWVDGINGTIKRTC